MKSSVTRMSRHYWLKESKVALWWSNLWFIGLHKKISFETTTRFIQWICAGISLTGSDWDVGGGYMVATDPFFVQKSSMWPPHYRFTVSLTAVNLRLHKFNEKTCKAALCWLLFGSLRACTYVRLFRLHREQVSLGTKVKSPTSGSGF